ncbi:uncharacterized protein LOC127246903 [Andrographis paniculata]|uniref:uncharacterized protein LOC127246903 n=1 Tax=Andrographis paniculata TaxID=175694 RepID=UPI0021E800E2|nr:uncharacterized protein LOC127246903 [Andrographis paniculata]
MGRAPCCDKANVKKGPWSPEEDAKLKSYIDQHGTGGNWIALPQKIGLKRCGKSCRLRWLNYLRPNIRHGGFSEEEDNIICSLYISIGSRWSIIAAQLPGRTDNDIKNYWNTRLKKKLLGKQRKGKQKAARDSASAIRGITKPNCGGDNAAGAAAIPNSLVFLQQPPPLAGGYGGCLPPQLPPPPPSVLPPVPYLPEEPRFNDHASIRRLLIKLGGRFSDEGGGDDQIADHHRHQYPAMSDISVINQNSYCSMDLTASNSMSQIPVINTAVLSGEAPWGGVVDLSNEAMERLMFDYSNVKMHHNNNNGEKEVEGLDFLYDHESSTVMDDWGEINTNMIFHAPASQSGEGFLQGSTAAMEAAAGSGLEEVVAEKMMIRYHDDQDHHQFSDGL